MAKKPEDAAFAVYVLADQHGQYAVGRDRAEAVAIFEQDHGRLDAETAYRWVKLRVKMPLPGATRRATRLAVAVPSEPLPEVDFESDGDA